MPLPGLVPTFRPHGRKSVLFIGLACSPAHLSECRSVLVGSGVAVVVTVGPASAAHLAVASVSLPEPCQPELLEEGDETLQDAVDAVH